MKITIPKVEISKKIESYHNYTATHAFQELCKVKNLSIEVATSEDWATIRLDHRTYKDNGTPEQVFANIQTVVEQIEKYWGATYESGVYSKKQFDGRKPL